MCCSLQCKWIVITVVNKCSSFIHIDEKYNGTAQSQHRLAHVQRE
jgi:hypothetical protein